MNSADTDTVTFTPVEPMVPAAAPVDTAMNQAQSVTPVQSPPDSVPLMPMPPIDLEQGLTTTAIIQAQGDMPSIQAVPINVAPALATAANAARALVSESLDTAGRALGKLDTFSRNDVSLAMRDISYALADPNRSAADRNALLAERTELSQAASGLKRERQVARYETQQEKPVANKERQESNGAKPKDDKAADAVLVAGTFLAMMTGNPALAASITLAGASMKAAEVIGDDRFNSAGIKNGPMPYELAMVGVIARNDTNGVNNNKNTPVVVQPGGSMSLSTRSNAA